MTLIETTTATTRKGETYTISVFDRGESVANRYRLVTSFGGSSDSRKLEAARKKVANTVRYFATTKWC